MGRLKQANNLQGEEDPDEIQSSPQSSCYINGRCCHSVCDSYDFATR